MTVAELIEALQRYPLDMRVMAQVYDCMGDACVCTRTVLPSEDERTFDGATAPFKAVFISGEDETHTGAD